MSDGSSAQPAAAGVGPATLLWLIAGLLMLQPLATDLYLPALPGIAAYFDVGVATVQWTLSIFVATFGAWQLVAGPLSDRFGRYPVVVAGAFVYCGASLLAMAAPTIEVLVGARLLQAAGACSSLVGARGIVRDLRSPTEAARLLASASTIMSFAPLLGPLLGAYLFVAFGWRSAFAALAALSVLLATAAATRLQETNRRRNPNALRLRPMLRIYLEVARSPAFRAYTLASTATYGGLFAFISGSSFVLMRVLGLSAVGFAASFATMVAGYLVGTLICRWLVARRGLQRTIGAGAALQVLAGTTMAALVAAGVHVPASIVAPMFFYGVAHGMIQPPAQAGAMAPFPHSAGAAAALMGFVMMLTAALVGLWIGASYDGTMFPLAFTICAASVASALVAFTAVRRHGDVAAHG
ncbi:MAG: multidrug effflux MFS transporter [Burkholderiales bacterium]|nr:MAG: multidrug effflux MFS transporter [Burkholderiales bacterium]